MRFVHDALGMTLDYSHETLPILDHYLAERARGEKAEITDLLAPAAGAYFGEVVRRSVLGANWHCPDGNYPEHRLEWEPFFLSFNPIGVAIEVLTMKPSEGWGAHFQVLDEAREAIAHSLEVTSDFSDDDYYTFSVRYEALEQVADVLGGIESHQPKRRHFSPSVYRAAGGSSTGSGIPS